MNIRPLTPPETLAAIDWAAAEGWNPGLSDLPAFLAQDPGLFLGAFDDTGLTAIIAATRYGADFGFIGFYIARPDRRGQGHGIAVWRAAMARLAGRLVGLDGVVAQQANYRASGFSLAWNNIRFGGAVVPSRPAAGIRAARDMPFAALATLDRSTHPAPRDAFLRAWLTTPGHNALAHVTDGAVDGFGVARPCREGHKIGPLVAQTPAVAEALARALSPGGPLFLDVPEPHAAARHLAESLGLAPVFETARMYTGPAPAIRMERLFGIASFELG